MKYKPKHRRNVRNPDDRYTDAQRVSVCLGTHCLGLLRGVEHRNSYNPVHLSPVTSR